MNRKASELCMGCMSPISGEMLCPHCGYDNSGPHDKQYRTPGSDLVDRYIIGRLLKKNGEGATYVGYDDHQDARVFIREYYPHTLAKRDPLTGEVAPKEGYGAQFKTLLSDFVDICNEVKRLSITEPVVPIDDVVAAKGTVYAVYRDLHLMSLEAHINKLGGKLDIAQARDLMVPLLNALSNIHARSGDIHRGISPYTVYINRAGELYIWDFCMSAARTGGSELEAELFTGYSAPEQYMSNGWQGTWTDVYAAAALFYRMVSGFVPPKSTVIGGQKPLPPLSDLVMDLPQHVSDAVEEAMQASTDRRTQEIGTFTSRLLQSGISSTAVYDTNVVSEVKRKREERRAIRAEKRRRGMYVALGLLITVLLLGGSGWFIMSTYFPDLINNDDVAVGSNVPTLSTEPGDDESGTDPDSSDEESSQTLPDFVGRLLTDVESDPTLKDRYYFEVKPEYNEAHESGVIVEQTPPAGTLIAENRTVILTVSKGKQSLTMPDLIGKTLEEAKGEMERLAASQDIDLPVNYFERDVEGAEAGKVVSTTPPAGTEFVPKETNIVVIYTPEGAEEEEVVDDGAQVVDDGPMTADQLESHQGSTEPFEPLREIDPDKP